MEFMRQPGISAALLRSGNGLRKLPTELLDAQESCHMFGSLPAAAHRW
jgi:hypothetical protein